MIPQSTFDRMLVLVKSVGTQGKNMPNFGPLRDIAPDQMVRLNGAYNDARNVHAGKSK